MNKNFKYFLIKAGVLLGIIVLTRVIFQFPVEYYGLKIFKQTVANRIFSKIDALKVVSLVAIFFALFYRRKIDKLNHPKINIKNSILFLFLAELMVAFYYLFRASTNLYGLTSGFSLLFAQFAILFSLAVAFFYFALAVFGMSYLKSFIKDLKKELIGAGLISIILYYFLMFFQNQWLFFSKGIARILYLLLSLFFSVGSRLATNGTPVLDVQGFAIAIGPPCSGIDSMLLFIAFSAAIYALDYNRLKKGLYGLIFVIGFAGVYLMNVLRLFLLIIAGVHISPEFAVGLFHTNAGWLLFVVYFVCYYLVIKRFIYKKDIPKKK